MYSKSPPSLTPKLIRDALRRHAKLTQQTFKPRIVAVVEDDKARVEIIGPGVCLDVHRVGVSPGPVACLEHDQLVIAVQRMRAQEPGDSRSDDRDPHACPTATDVCRVIYIALFCICGRRCAGRWAADASCLPCAVSASSPGVASMIGPLLDTFLDRTILPGYTRVGYRLRAGAWSAAEMQSMDGKVVLLTGGTSGLGLAAGQGFARLGATVWLAARSKQRGERARAQIAACSPHGEVQVGLCDLSDLKSVRQFAESLSKETGRLDVLVNNAAH